MKTLITIEGFSGHNYTRDELISSEQTAELTFLKCWRSLNPLIDRSWENMRFEFKGKVYNINRNALRNSGFDFKNSCIIATR